MSIEIDVKGKKAKIFLNKDEIENETLKQIKAMVNEDAIQNARIMPDCHKSKNCCVGFTSKLIDKIVPNYVGNDIGCGIVSYPIELEKSIEEMRDKTIKKIVDNIHSNIAVRGRHTGIEILKDELNDSLIRIFDLANQDIVVFQKYYKIHFGRDLTDKLPNYNHEWLEEFLKRVSLAESDFYGSLMTLGKGNHFIEFNRSDTTNKEYVTVHSGSRIVGKKICDFHQKKLYSLNNEEQWEEFDKKVVLFNKKNKDKKERLEYRNKLRDEMNLRVQSKKKYLDEDDAIDYYIDMIFGQKYAIVNRELMIKYVLNKLSESLIFNPEKKIESIHNYIDFESLIMRKGAISAREGELCLIALNMAEGILLCEGKGNEDWNYSCAHGAGRKITREKAIKSRIPILKRLEKIMEEKGVYSGSILRILVDEAPECYKDSDVIIERIQPSIEIKEHLKPFINIKNEFIDKEVI